ncbi:hypothetical protein HNO89_002034 [Sporosarcina luteola]|nr:hypothetical protein [Sporosarcina luteola]
MEIQYELTEEDVVVFNVHHVKNSNVGRNSLRWQRVVSPLLFLLFAYFLSVSTDLEAGTLFVVFGVTAILWVLFYPKYFYWHVTRQVRKALKEGKNEGLVGSHVLKMNKQGLTDTTSNGESKMTWQAVKQFKEDTGHFYLYNSAVSAFIIPKRDVDAEAFRKFVNKWLSH